MVHALAEFVQQRAKAKGWGSTEFSKHSGLSKQLCNTWLKDSRDKVSRLPEPATIAGFKKAFNVPTEFLLGKAIESLSLGYSSGDFINSVTTATDRELLDEIERRLTERGEGHGSSPAPIVPMPPKTGRLKQDEIEETTHYAGRTAARIRQAPPQPDPQKKAGEESQDPEEGSR